MNRFWILFTLQLQKGAFYSIMRRVKTHTSSKCHILEILFEIFSFSKWNNCLANMSDDFRCPIARYFF